MAFETVDQWQVKRRAFLPGLGAFSMPELPNYFPYREYFKKIPSAVFALILHGLFLYFFVSATFNREIERPANPSSAEPVRMTMIELKDSVEEVAESVPAMGEVKPQSASTTPTLIEVSAEAELPAEWSVGRVRVARSEVSDSASAMAVETGTGSIGSGDRSNGVYDPFAGAAPNREQDEPLTRGIANSKKTTVVEKVTGFFGFGGGDKIDPDAFEQLVGNLRQRLPRAKGSVLLSVSLDGKGQVKNAKIVGGTASAQVKFFVRNAVVGKQLAGGQVRQNDGRLKLPVISFG